ncbi:MAG TPA: YceH family protein [Acidimicrobiales bacterium]|nr:YceH family protein [Acidimicrobiales bacterium]
MRLSHEEARVIGSLIEKQLTTPQQYPLTLNALQLACNQTSNRDPVVEFDERTVADALASLKAAGLVRFVHPAHGRSVTRYEQALGQQLAATQEQLALVGVLLLRGPQTVGELRSRTERMCDFDGIARIEDELSRLSNLAGPVVARLPRRPGQKEERWAQLLAASRDNAAPYPLAEAGDDVGTTEEKARHDEGLASQVAQLQLDVAALRLEVAGLGEVVTQLREQLEALRQDLYN